jgi:hypothetical protein
MAKKISPANQKKASGEILRTNLAKVTLFYHPPWPNVEVLANAYPL